MSAERWLPVVGHEGLYEVSDRGNVRSLPRVVVDADGRTYPRGGQRLTPHNRGGRGYLFVGMSREGKVTHRPVHQLVLEAFTGPRTHGQEACHNDGNPSNNLAGNLRWGTRSENALDRVAHGTHSTASKTHCAKGHPYDAANTMRTREGWRKCKTCNREQCTRRYRKHTSTKEQKA